MRIQLIGDEIHADGELVAILTTNAAPTLRGHFEDAIRDVDIGDDTPDAKVLDVLEEKAQESAKGGLLRMSDLSRIVRQLKEPQ